MNSTSSKVIDKLEVDTAGGLLKWFPFHQYTDDLENPYMYHQHFVPSESYSLNTQYGKFFLITFRMMSQFPEYIENVLLCFVTTDNTEVINDTSMEVFTLKTTIQKTFILDDPAMKNSILPSNNLLDYLDS